MFKEYAHYDATGLAELIARRELTPAELLETAVQRAEASQPRLNAICVKFYDEARARAAAPLQGPFAGVPLLIKDISQYYAGQPCTMGSNALRDWRPSEHSLLVQRWLDAGFVIFGRTTTPELGLKAVTETRRWGVTRNPWNTERTPGGSSGGAAAVVAAGVVPVAGASDGGGSIRIPAAYCGLFGLKPSRGLVSFAPIGGEMWDGAAIEHALTRSVRDSAALLDCVAGSVVGDPFRVMPPAEGYASALQRPPGRLRIGYSHRAPLGTPVDAECVRAVEQAAKLLESLGHHVEPAEPEVDGEALARSYLTMYFGQVAAAVAQLKASGAREQDFEPETRALALIGRRLSADRYVAERGNWNLYARALGRFHSRYDLWLSPTTAMAPARIGELDLPWFERVALAVVLALRAGGVLQASGTVEAAARLNLARTPFTQLSNLTGTPSMSVPLHWGADGLPYGVQFVGRHGEESLLFSLAAQLEQAQPWFDRVPPQPRA